jgi:glycosyltransferase involved in cell wall biosynthesis
MKIGFDAKRAFRNSTGLGNYSRFIINALLKFAPENEYVAYSPKNSKQLAVGSRQFENNNLKLPTANYKLPTGLWRTWLIINDLQRDNINIYHGLSNELPFGIKKSGIKSVVTIHDLIFLRYPKLYPFFDRLIYKIKFKYACKNTDAIIAISEQTKRDIIEFYKISPEKITVIYQDCEEIFQKKLSFEAINEVKTKYNLQKKYILSVGTITKRKNQLSLVKAFQALNLEDYELILVGGKTTYQNEIEHYIQQQNLGNVQILNNLPFVDLPAIYQGAEVFVYPSIFEGFGIPIIEALHSGVPVVATTGSCLEEAGGNGAIYANPLNINNLAHKIHQALTNENLRNELILKGKEHVKKFSSEQIANDLVRLYTKIYL